MASQVALRDSIKLTFPEKKVLAVGNGSSKFSYIGKLDKLEELEHALLIVVDLPDKKELIRLIFQSTILSLKLIIIHL